MESLGFGRTLKEHVCLAKVQNSVVPVLLVGLFTNDSKIAGDITKYNGEKNLDQGRYEVVKFLVSWPCHCAVLCAVHLHRVITYQT